MDDQQFLDEEKCKIILTKFLNSSDFDLSSFQIVPFHKALEGLIGEHFTLEINFTVHQKKSRKQRFFLKTLNSNKVMFELTNSVCVYEKEEFFYTNLLPGFEQIQIDCSFAPRGYFFEPYTVVLEDLLSEGYKGTTKRKPLDLDHCQICLETLAKLHFAGLKYNKLVGLDLNKYSNVLEDKFFSGEDNGATRWLKCSINGLFQLIDLVVDDNKSGDFKEKLSEMLERARSMSEIDVDGINTILHGDLWSSNFLFAYKDNRPISGKLVDYQTIKFGPVQMDLMQFIMSNTRRRFRDENFQELIGYYYVQLREMLINDGLESLCGLTRAEFTASCRIFKLAAKVFAIVDRSLTFMSDETYGKAMESEESFRRFLFEERGKYIVESFRQNEEFRDVLLEDVMELREILLE